VSNNSAKSSMSSVLIPSKGSDEGSLISGSGTGSGSATGSGVGSGSACGCNSFSFSRKKSGIFSVGFVSVSYVLAATDSG